MKVPQSKRGVAIITAAMARRMERTDDMLASPRRTLKEMGLPVPPKLPRLEDEDAFPTDITRLSDVEVRSLMSFWTAYYGYANATLGRYKGRVAILSRVLINRKYILFQQLKPEKKTADWSEAIHGQVQLNPEVRKYERILAEAEGMVAVMEPLVWTYMRYSEVASKEITARFKEAEREFDSGSRRKRSP